MIVIVMGVAGSGKTTIGRMLAERLGSDFLDADSLQSPANLRKIADGKPLTDADRRPWLDTLHETLSQHAAKGASVVLACSALKETFRRTIAGRLPVRWVYLKIPLEIAHQRAGQQARGHSVRAQFDTLEEPKNALTVNASNPPEEVVATIVNALRSWDEIPRLA